VWRPTIFATVSSGLMIRNECGTRVREGRARNRSPHPTLCGWEKVRMGANVCRPTIFARVGASGNGSQSAGRMGLGPDSFSVRWVAVRVALCSTLTIFSARARDMNWLRETPSSPAICLAASLRDLGRRNRKVDRLRGLSGLIVPLITANVER
jgi:hypothetical protein